MHKTDLAPGDWLVCYTDGLSESRSPGTDSFFEEKILPTLAGVKTSAPQTLIDRLVTGERTHRANGRQLDDLTILVGGLT